jgi:hypothetical protein
MSRSRKLLVLVVSVGLLGACASQPNCPKPTTPPPPCKPRVKKDVKQGSMVPRAYANNYAMRKSFNTWVSAYGAHPWCRPTYVNPRYPGELTVECRYPGKPSYVHAHPMPLWSSDTLGSCPGEGRLVDVKVVQDGVKFGKWLRFMASRSRLVTKYHKGVPYVCTVDLKGDFCLAFPISAKRKRCLRVAYNAAVVKQQKRLAVK